MFVSLVSPSALDAELVLFVMLNIAGIFRKFAEKGEQKLTDQIKSYKDLKVFQNAMDRAMEIFELTKSFPVEEKEYGGQVYV